jgi:hypothetical protein
VVGVIAVTLDLKTMSPVAGQDPSLDYSLIFLAKEERML